MIPKALKKRQRIIASLILVVLLSSCNDRSKTESGNTISDSNFKIVGYLGGGGISSMDHLELERLTHLNLAFANPDDQGKLVFNKGMEITPAVVNGHEAGLKVYISIAGGGKPDTAIWNAMLHPKRMPGFIENIISFVKEHNLDGVDVDIEGNLLPFINNRYESFVLELKKALHSEGKGITCALGATWLHESVTQKSLEAYDFINVMVYDKTGPWRPERPGPHSPYAFAEDALEFWIDKKGISQDKIVLGMPFYGWDFSSPPRSKRYKHIVRDNPSDAYRDQKDSLFYNGIPTIVSKTKLAIAKAGGVMFWEISQDTVHDLSLLRAVHQTIQAGDCDVKTYYFDEDGDGFGDATKPIQACIPPKGYVDAVNQKE